MNFFGIKKLSNKTRNMLRLKQIQSFNDDKYIVKKVTEKKNKVAFL
jgi:hypothetical protein